MLYYNVFTDDSEIQNVFQLNNYLSVSYKHSLCDWCTEIIAR